MVITLLVQACGQKRGEEPCNFVLNNYDERVSWNSGAPIELYMHESFPRVLIPALERAMERWKEVIGRQIFTISGYVEGENRPRKDGYSVIYYLLNWDSSDSKQAVTGTHWRGDEIKEADIKVNGRNYRYSFGESVDVQKVDFESLMVHELGHVLGLAHNDSLIGSVMSWRLEKGEIRRNIPEGDRESLSCEY